MIHLNWISHILDGLACNIVPLFPFKLSQQETTEGRRVLCANAILDKANEEHLSQRVANRVYDDARAGHLKLCGFPDYGPVVQALQNAAPQDSGKQYQVTVKKDDRLVILASLAAKWVDSEFKDEVAADIKAHNAKYNVDGEYWHELTERLIWVRHGK